MAAGRSRSEQGVRNTQAAFLADVPGTSESLNSRFLQDGGSDAFVTVMGKPGFPVFFQTRQHGVSRQLEILDFKFFWYRG